MPWHFRAAEASQSIFFPWIPSLVYKPRIIFALSNSPPVGKVADFLRFPFLLPSQSRPLPVRGTIILTSRVALRFENLPIHQFNFFSLMPLLVASLTLHLSSHVRIFDRFLFISPFSSRGLLDAMLRHFFPHSLCIFFRSREERESCFFLFLRFVIPPGFFFLPEFDVLANILFLFGLMLLGGALLAACLPGLMNTFSFDPFFFLVRFSLLFCRCPNQSRLPALK